MRIKETLKLDINGTTVTVLNDGIKKFKHQHPDALEALKEMIAENLRNGITNDWTPYANFEASVTWSVITLNKEA